MYSLAAFFRMYIMAMFWCTLLTYLLLHHLEKEKLTKKFFLQFALIVTAGALTHYHCILYEVLISVVFCLILIRKRSYSDLLKYILASAVSGISTVLLFPPIIQHLLTSRRGKEAFANLSSSFSGYPQRAIEYLRLADTYLFGRLLVVILAGILLLLMLQSRRKTPVVAAEQKEKYILALVPTLLYFLFICKTAPYLDHRYMTPIYAVLLTAVFAFLFDLLCCFENKKRIFLMILVILAVCGNGLRLNDWKYLRYKETHRLTEFAENNRDLDCVLIYPVERLYGNAHAAFSIIKDYRSITFVREDHLEELLYGSELIDKQELVLLVPGRKTEIMEEVLKHCPKMNDSTRLGMYIYSTVYHLHP